MKKLLFIITFIFINLKGFAEEGIEDLFCSSTEQIATLASSEDFLIGGIIHPLSGQPYLQQTDLIAKGAQSLALKRTFIPFYAPLNEHKGKIHPSKNSYSGWVYFPHAHLNVFKSGKNKGNEFIVAETIVSVADPQGSVLAYQIDQHGSTTLKAKPWGICNGIGDCPSGIYDPRNTLISVGERDVTLQAPDGTKRYYRCSGYYDLTIEKKHYACLYCLLEKEILPNGKVLRYSYNKERQVAKVESMDPKERYIYATLTIDTTLTGTHATCSTNTGLQATYEHNSAKFFKRDKHEWHADLLYPLRITNVNSPNFRNEVIQYQTNFQNDSILKDYSGKHPIFKCTPIFIPEKKKEKKRWLVDELFLPSEANIFSSVYSMRYALGAPGEKKSITEVSHCDGLKTVYTFNLQMLPEKISEYDEYGILFREKTFTWTFNQWLKSIAITDGKQLFYEKKFEYDSFGNPVHEALIGDLTGSGTKESDEIKRIFSSDRRNLLLREEHSTGKVTCFTYLPETNLLTSRLIKEHGLRCLSREFRRYDDCHNLIEVIYDDGCAEQAEDLSNVTERKIIRYGLRQQQPFLHLPEYIEEKYLEKGVEKLLKKTSLVYDQWGNVAQEHVYDANGDFAYTILLEYDEQGNLLSETNPLGQKATYTFDTYGREKTTLNFSNNLQTFRDYDAKGRLIKTQEVSEGITRNAFFVYDHKNRLRRKTDSNDHSTTYTYNLIANQPIEINQPNFYHADGQKLAVIEKAKYDTLNRKILSVDPNGNQTSYQYNLYGSPTNIIYPDQSQESFRYTTKGLLINHTFKNGLSISHEHDVLGNIIGKSYIFEGNSLGREQFIFKGNKLLKSIDLEGNSTQYTYDGLGRKTSENRNGCLTTYQYDSLGELATVCEKNGENSLYTHFKRDLLGKVLEKKKTDANGNILIKLAYTYDGNGNIKTIERKINGQEAIETFAYDAYNRKIFYQDAQGNVTTTHFDEKAVNSFGQQVLQKTTKDPQNISTVETFDPYERLVKQEKVNLDSKTISSKEIDYDACGNQLLYQNHVYQGTDYLATKSVKWTYDPCHRVKKLTRGFNTPDERTTSWTYHPSGKIATKTLPDGIVLNYTYDSLNNLTEIRSFDGKLCHYFRYNCLGHLLETSDEVNDLKITREVDPNGNVLIETFPNGIQIRKTYDYLNRPTAITLPDGSKIVYHYDPLFLRKVQRLAPSGEILYAHTYESYDESGYLLTEHLPADLGSVHHKMDNKGQPISLFSDYFTQDCQYNLVGNLISQTINGKNLSFSYDEHSQLTSEPSYLYSYDSLYNRTRENKNEFQYNTLDENSSFFYDPRGNLIQKSESLKFCYDPLDRLVEAETKDQKISYCYDPLGRKLSKSVNSEKKEFFLYDGQNEIGVISDNEENKQLKILGAGSHPENKTIVAIELGEKPYIPILDIHGNVRVLIDIDSKTVAASYNYTAFGKQLALPSFIFNPWQYASKRFDPDLGLINFGSRHYDPFLGRWLSTDPAGFIDSYNLYQFNFNNPFRYYDPNGKCAFVVPLIWGIFELGAAITVEITAEAIISAAIASAVAWGAHEVLTGVQHTVDRPQSPETTKQNEDEEEKRTGEKAPQAPPFNGSELGDDPTKCPGEGFEWRGNGPPSSGKGSWVRGEGGSKESLHPDINHPKPKGPHWDYEGPGFPNGARLYPNGSWEVKNGR